MKSKINVKKVVIARPIAKQAKNGYPTNESKIKRT